MSVREQIEAMRGMVDGLRAVADMVESEFEPDPDPEVDVATNLRRWAGILASLDVLAEVEARLECGDRGWFVQVPAFEPQFRVGLPVTVLVLRRESDAD